MNHDPRRATRLPGWALQGAAVIGIAILAERILDRVVETAALPAALRGWVDVLGLALVLGPLVGWLFYRRPRDYERLAMVAELTSNAVIITDASRRIIWVNRAFQHMTGYSAEEAIGRSPGRLLHGPETDQATVAKIRAALAEERPIRTAILNYTKDGRSYWIDLSIEPTRAANGTLRGFISVVSDITRLMEVQRTLEAERERLQRLTAQAEEAQAVARVGNWEYELASGRIEWSSGTYWLFGRDPAAGPPSLEDAMAGYAPRAAAKLQAAIERSMATGEPYSFVLRTSARNPAVHYVSANGRVRRDAEGRIVALYGTAADVTASVELQAALEAARRAAEAASESKSEFLANMSHEIRTPLTVVLGFTDVLRDKALQANADQAQLQTLSSIKRAGEHLLTVINDILDISKIEAGRMVIEQVEYDLSALFRDVESLMRPRAAAKGVQLRLQATTALPRRARLDPTRLRQILVNLTGNAVKFTGRGEVRLEARMEGASTLVVGVEDTGVGMTAEQSANLFQPFMQADTSTTRQFGGTGLGLTISRRLARLMGGDVTLVYSEPGRGTRFELRVPLEPLPDTEEIVEFSSAVSSLLDSALPADALAGRRILLAEDGPDNQVLIRIVLEAVGAEVDIASNGREAADLVLASAPGERRYDLILSDMQMPEMDGYTLARYLRGSGCELPIIALTANAMAEDRERCLAAGCSDYATKPIDRRVLIETCMRWLADRPKGGEPRAVVRSTLADHAIIGKLARSFAEALPSRVASIEETLAAENLEDARRLAHQLRGSGGSYGYPDVTEAAGRLEDALEAGQRPEARRAASDLATVASAVLRGLSPAD